MNIASRLLLTAAAAVVPGVASACVEAERGYLGEWTIRNGCGKTISVAWCFGGGCRPDPDTARRLTPGFQLVAGHVKQSIHFIHCTEPKRFGADGRCR